MHSAESMRYGKQSAPILREAEPKYWPFSPNTLKQGVLSPVSDSTTRHHTPSSICCLYRSIGRQSTLEETWPELLECTMSRTFCHPTWRERDRDTEELANPPKSSKHSLTHAWPPEDTCTQLGTDVTRITGSVPKETHLAQK